MPATYSFSLNFRKDRDIIDLMENAKNKSQLIRTSLHANHRLEVYKEYAEKLERLVDRYAKELGWERPSFSRMLEHCFSIKEEERLLKEPSPPEFHNSSQEQE